MVAPHISEELSSRTLTSLVTAKYIHERRRHDYFLNSPISRCIKSCKCHFFTMVRERAGEKKEDSRELCVENFNDSFPKRERVAKSIVFSLPFSGALARLKQGQKILV